MIKKLLISLLVISSHLHSEEIDIFCEGKQLPDNGQWSSRVKINSNTNEVFFMNTNYVLNKIYDYKYFTSSMKGLNVNSDRVVFSEFLEPKNGGVLSPQFSYVIIDRITGFFTYRTETLGEINFEVKGKCSKFDGTNRKF